LILCFDGTGNQPGDRNTNVVEFCQLLRNVDNRQKFYYKTGIGSGASGSLNTNRERSFHLPNKWDQYREQAFASNIDKYIKDGYDFLMREYKKGDHIYLFGFSRGAYIARALAGMLDAVGLLRRDPPTDKSINDAYKCYKGNNGNKWTQFKSNSSISVNIEFVGVWDTVASVGIHRILPLIESNTSIKTFRHALALDERRIKFEPVYYVGTQVDNTSAHEVWFLGCHGNVGGGSVATGTNPSLQRVALRWMVKECINTGAGILFKSDALRELFKNSAEEDMLAASDTKGIHDELISGPRKGLWRIVEYIPTFNNASDRSLWKSFIPSRRPNLFRARTIPGVVFKCHTTVKTRICKVPGYEPQANLKRPIQDVWSRRADVSDCQWVDSDFQPVRNLLQ